MLARLCALLALLALASGQTGMATQAPTASRGGGLSSVTVPPTTAPPVSSPPNPVPTQQRTMTGTSPVPTPFPSALPTPTQFPTLNFALMPLTLVQTVVSTGAQLTAVPPLTIVPRAASSLDEKSAASSTVKASKRQEVLETADVHIPSPRQLQQQTSLPTIAGYSVGPSYMSFWSSYTFTGLGNNAQRQSMNSQQRYYLQSMFIEAGFGGAADPAYSANGMIKQQLIRVYAAVPGSPFGYVQVAVCDPKKQRTDCSTGLPERSCFTPDGLDWWPVPNAAISDAQGGSLQLVFATEGFLSAPCSTSIQVRYTLSGSPQGIAPISPTFYPTYPPADHGAEHGAEHGEEEEEEDEEDDDPNDTDEYMEDEEEHNAALDTIVLDSIDTPIFAISMSVGAAVYLLMGLRLLVIRQRYWEVGITPITGGIVICYFLLLGIQFSLEITLGAILLHSGWWKELGLGIILSRLACWLPSFYTLGTIYQSGYYTKILNEQQLNENMISYMIFNFYVFSDTQLLSYFPWASTLFTRLNYGMPDVERIRISIGPKFLQIIVSLICTAIFIDHIARELHLLEEAPREEEDEDEDDEGDAEPAADHGIHTGTGHPPSLRRRVLALTVRRLFEQSDGVIECPEKEMHDDINAEGEHIEHSDDDFDCMYHAEFVKDLWTLWVWACVTLAFTVVVLCTLFYTVFKHLSMIPLDTNTWSSDLYDRSVRDDIIRSMDEQGGGGGGGGNKFMERNIELPHGRLSLSRGSISGPPPVRASFTGVPMGMPGGPPPPGYGASPMHPMPPHMYPHSPGPSPERRVSMQQAMNEQSFRGRPSLDGRRSSLGLPVDRRPSFDGRPPPPHGTRPY